MDKSEMNISHHDVKEGYLNHCQICNSKKLKKIINLGKQPLADSLLKKKISKKRVTQFPLGLVRCLECGLTQLNYIVSGKIVYHKDYPYRPGITKSLKDYQNQLSSDLIKQYSLNKKSLVIDIGSNDGTLLSGFKKKCRILGIEPTNTAKIAKKNNINTIQDFTNEKLAKNIVNKFGKADLITATNVFAHMADLGKVIRSIKILLNNDGYFVLENHYLLDIIKDLQFDSIYHEHIRTYSLKPIIKLFSYYNLKVVKAERGSRYGGNIRVHISNNLDERVDKSIKNILNLENKFGLYNNKVYKKFFNDVLKSKKRLINFLKKIKSKEMSVVAKACPARANTLLNFYGITNKEIPYIAEQPTSLKLGYFLPCSNIPIVDSRILLKDKPDYVLILAWHLWQPIVKKWKKRGLKSKFIIPLPKFKIV
jgi:SAM-dependent methyltransferase